MLGNAVMAGLVVFGGIISIVFVVFWIKEARGILSTEEKMCPGCLRETTQARRKRNMSTSVTVRSLHLTMYIPYVETKCNKCGYTHVAEIDMPLLNTNRQKAIDGYIMLLDDQLNKEIIKK